MRILHKTVFLLIIILFSSGLLFSIPADVEDISSRKYFPAVLKAIQESQKSIYACLYYISYTSTRKDKITILLNAIIEAKNRGVDVEIVLDKNKPYSAVRESDKKNVKSFSFLKKNGIKVFYDDNQILTHSKYLVIDEKLIITGSTNWSNNSLIRNREDSYILKSKELAEKKVKEFKQIPRFSPIVQKDSIPIPREFITDLNLASKMASTKNNKLFEFYLWIQKKSLEQETKEVKITNDILYEMFFKHSPVNFDKYKDYIQYFMKVHLNKCRKEYSFVKDYKTDRKTDVLTVFLDKKNVQNIESLYLSKLYWSDGWTKRLSLRAKFCLFILLDITNSSREGGYVIESQIKLKEKYDFGISVLSRGFTELQRYNLIEKDINVRFSGGIVLIPNGYMLNDFYEYSAFQKKLKKLEDKTDQKLFKAVAKIADMVDESSDLKVYKELISLGKKYGLKVLQDTVSVLEKNNYGATPYQQYKYVVTIIKAEGEGETQMSLLEFQELKKKKKLKKN